MTISGLTMEIIDFTMVKNITSFKINQLLHSISFFSLYSLSDIQFPRSRYLTLWLQDYPLYSEAEFLHRWTSQTSSSFLSFLHYVTHCPCHTLYLIKLLPSVFCIDNTITLFPMTVSIKIILSIAVSIYREMKCANLPKYVVHNTV